MSGHPPLRTLVKWRVDGVDYGCRRAIFDAPMMIFVFGKRILIVPDCLSFFHFLLRLASIIGSETYLRQNKAG